MLHLLSEPKEILETHQWLDWSVEETLNTTSPPPPPPPPARPQRSIYVSRHRPRRPFSAICRQNRPCWRDEWSLSWKFQPSPEIARVPCLMFPDDILLFSSSADPLISSQELTHAVTNVYKWLGDRGLKMNVKKTQAKVVLASQALSQEDLTMSVVCCDRQLSTVHSCKYLGVVLDSKLTWAPQKEHLIRKVSSKIGVPYRSSKKLSPDAKRQHYLSVIQSDLVIGSNVFYSSLPQTAKEHLSRLRKRGCMPFSARPHGLRQNLSLEKWNFVPSTYTSGLNFSYTPIDAHTHLPVLYFVNSTNLDLLQTAHTAPLVFS